MQTCARMRRLRRPTAFFTAGDARDRSKDAIRTSRGAVEMATKEIKKSTLFTGQGRDCLMFIDGRVAKEEKEEKMMKGSYGAGEMRAASLRTTRFMSRRARAR